MLGGMSDLPSSGHAVIDVAYLSDLTHPARPPDGAMLDAAEWRRALQYAGVLPVLRQLGGGSAPAGSLEADLRGVAVALGRLDRFEARGRSARGQAGSVPPWLLPGGPDRLMVSHHPMLGAVALGAVALMAVLSFLGGRPDRGLTTGERSARAGLVTAVRALLAHSRVEAVGPNRRVVEVAPHAGNLRARVHQLDDVVVRAQSRARTGDAHSAHPEDDRSPRRSVDPTARLQSLPRSRPR